MASGQGNDLSCIFCCLYCGITVEVWGHLKVLRNAVDGLRSFHVTERNLVERRAVGLNSLYEEVIIKEAATAAATAMAEDPSSSTYLSAAAAVADSNSPSSKWTWGMDLSEKDVLCMVHMATNSTAPHSVSSVPHVVGVSASAHSNLTQTEPFSSYLILSTSSHLIFLISSYLLISSYPHQ